MEQPRLFQCSDFSGKMQITEIRDFDQQVEQLFIFNNHFIRPTDEKSSQL